MEGDYENCTEMLQILDKTSFDAIAAIVETTPTITEVQKKFFMEVLRLRWNELYRLRDLLSHISTMSPYAAKVQKLLDKYNSNRKVTEVLSLLPATEIEDSLLEKMVCFILDQV